MPLLTVRSVPATSIETVKTWGFRGGYTHNWDPYWATALYGGYAQLKYGNNTKTTLCGVARNGVGGTLGIAAGVVGFVGALGPPALAAPTSTSV